MIFRYPPAVWNEEEELQLGAGDQGRGSMDGCEEDWDEDDVEYMESVIHDERKMNRKVIWMLRQMAMSMHWMLPCLTPMVETISWEWNLTTA